MRVSAELLNALQTIQGGIDRVCELGWEMTSFRVYSSGPEDEGDRLEISMRKRPETELRQGRK